MGELKRCPFCGSTDIERRRPEGQVLADDIEFAPLGGGRTVAIVADGQVFVPAGEERDTYDHGAALRDFQGGPLPYPCAYMGPRSAQQVARWGAFPETSR